MDISKAVSQKVAIVRPHTPPVEITQFDTTAEIAVTKADTQTMIAPHSPPVQTSPIISGGTIVMISADEEEDPKTIELPPGQSPPYIPPIITPPSASTAPNVLTKPPYGVEPHEPPVMIDEPAASEDPFAGTPLAGTGGIKAPYQDPATTKFPIIKDHSPPVQDPTLIRIPASVTFNKIPSDDVIRPGLIAPHGPVNIADRVKADPAVREFPGGGLTPHLMQLPVTPIEDGPLYDPAILGPSKKPVVPTVPTKHPPIVEPNPGPTDRMIQTKPKVKAKVGLIAPHSPPVQTIASNRLYNNAQKLITDTSAKAIFSRAYQQPISLAPVNLTA